MPFVLSHDARKFFERIGVKSSQSQGKSTTGCIETFFDAHWLCAQVGMLNNEFKTPESGTPMITNKFAGSPSKNMHLIRGVAFYFHCKRRGLISAKDGVLDEMISFFSEEAKEMGESGYALMNGYACGGFELIYERLGDHCFELSQFLLEYQDMILGD